MKWLTRHSVGENKLRALMRRPVPELPFNDSEVESEVERGESPNKPSIKLLPSSWSCVGESAPIPCSSAAMQGNPALPILVLRLALGVFSSWTGVVHRCERCCKNAELLGVTLHLDSEAMTWSPKKKSDNFIVGMHNPEFRNPSKILCRIIQRILYPKFLNPKAVIILFFFCAVRSEFHLQVWV